ncbi:MAG: hypothetical protein ABSG74_01265 [Candidatus Bathyarchaeia archaeon]
MTSCAGDVALRKTTLGLPLLREAKYADLQLPRCEILVRPVTSSAASGIPDRVCLLVFQNDYRCIFETLQSEQNSLLSPDDPKEILTRSHLDCPCAIEGTGQWPDFVFEFTSLGDSLLRLLGVQVFSMWFSISVYIRNENDFHKAFA